jgi:hypothetical protein
VNYAILKSELDDDPEGRGYSGMTDAEAADDLNAEYREANVESVTGQQIFEAAFPAEYDALSAGQKATFHAIVGMGDILVNGTNTKAALLAIFATGTTTRANLAALQKRPVSRATELELPSIDPGNIKSARAM